jgi:hypothetical protein
MMRYFVAFDAANLPTDWTPVLIGLAATTLGAFIAYKPQIPAAVGLKNFQTSVTIRWALLFFGIVWTCLAAVIVPEQAQAARNLARATQCTIIEGPVQNFHPMPYNGHDEESFTVTGVEFHYSDFILDGSFNNTASHGGPIRANLPVRICQAQGRIMKLEIAA